MLSAALVPKHPPLTTACGHTFTLLDGTVVQDMASQTLNLALGQCNKSVLEAVKEQLEKAQFASSRFATPPFMELSEKLAKLAPSGLSTVILKLSNGSDAVETAIKIARLHTRRRKVGVRTNAWHGESFGTLGLSSAHAGRLVSSSHDVQFSSRDDIDSLADLVEDCGDLCAAIVDPACVSSGLPNSDPSSALRRLRRACDHTGTLLIFDEIQTFGGYLGGSLFATEAFKVAPDIICLGKALGAGFPLAGVICANWLGGLLQYNDAEFTYGGHPVSCAAALAALQLLKEKQLEFEARIPLFEAAVRQAFTSNEYEVRVVGLIASIGLCGGRLSELWCARVVEQAMAAGIFIRSTDRGRRLLLKPPVLMDLDSLRSLLDTLRTLADSSARDLIPAHYEEELRIAGGAGKAVLARKHRVSREEMELTNSFGGGLGLRERNTGEQCRLSEELLRIGVPVAPIYEVPGSDAVCYGFIDGGTLQDVLEDSSDVDQINALALRHYEAVVLAHDHGFTIGSRLPANAIVSGNCRLSLINFGTALDGPFDTAALYEEIQTIFHTVGAISASGIRDDLCRRLVESLFRRHPPPMVANGIHAFERHHLNSHKHKVTTNISNSVAFFAFCRNYINFRRSSIHG